MKLAFVSTYYASTGSNGLNYQTVFDNALASLNAGNISTLPLVESDLASLSPGISALVIPNRAPQGIAFYAKRPNGTFALTSVDCELIVTLDAYITKVRGGITLGWYGELPQIPYTEEVEGNILPYALGRASLDPVTPAFPGDPNIDLLQISSGQIIAAEPTKVIARDGGDRFHVFSAAFAPFQVGVCAVTAGFRTPYNVFNNYFPSKGSSEQLAWRIVRWVDISSPSDNLYFAWAPPRTTSLPASLNYPSGSFVRSASFGLVNDKIIGDTKLMAEETLDPAQPPYSWGFSVNTNKGTVRHDVYITKGGSAWGVDLMF